MKLNKQILSALNEAQNNNDNAKAVFDEITEIAIKNGWKKSITNKSIAYNILDVYYAIIEFKIYSGNTPGIGIGVWDSFVDGEGYDTIMFAKSYKDFSEKEIQELKDIVSFKKVMPELESAAKKILEIKKILG